MKVVGILLLLALTAAAAYGATVGILVGQRVTGRDAGGTIIECTYAVNGGYHTIVQRNICPIGLSF